MAPHHGMPPGHLPVRSYLAVPVDRRAAARSSAACSSATPTPGVFTERAERLIVGIAAQAAIAIDNARLYEEARSARPTSARACSRPSARPASRSSASA